MDLGVVDHLHHEFSWRQQPVEGIDLADPELYATGDPHRLWRLLRETAPVHWTEKPLDPASGP